MKNFFTLSLVTTTAFVAACSAPEDPQGTVCKQMAEVLTARSQVNWETPAHSDLGDVLQVDLFSPDLNARCLFYRETDLSNDTVLRFEKMPYDTVPFEMTINGTKVAEADLIKSSFTATGMQFERSVNDTNDMAQQKARQAEEAARDAGQKIMEKAKELNR